MTALQGKEYDVAVGGTPFMLATTPDIPRTMETIPLRKDQFDTEADPGEQTLAGWWRRSQDSFHLGAGNRYQESRLSTDPSASFYNSENIDVFTKGQISLTRKMNTVAKSNSFSTTQAYPWALDEIQTFQNDYMRTNRFPNPSYRGTFSGTGGSGFSYANSSTRAFDGTTSCKITVANGTLHTTGLDFPLFDPANLVVGRSYDLLFYAWGTASNDQDLELSLGGPATGNPPITIAASGAWSLKLLTFTHSATFKPQFAPAGTVANASGDTWWIDAVLLKETNEIGTSYFDGTTSGASWLGATDGSWSTMRVAASAPKFAAITPAGDLITGFLDGTGQTNVTGPGSSKITAFTVAGGIIYYSKVLNGEIVGWGVDGTLQGSWETQSGLSLTKLLSAKYRLWGLGPREIYVIDTGLPFLSTQTPIFEHPDTAWNWRDLIEGPASMILAGDDGHSSRIYLLGLDDNGTVPTFTGARVSAILPDGELVQHMELLAGRYLGIGTNRGFRVGTVENDSITYGPLLFEPTGVTACTGVVAQGRFLLATFNSSEGQVIYKVDTGTTVNDLNPYSKDVVVSASGYIKSLAVTGTRIVALDSSSNILAQSTTELATSGFLETGRIRFHTNEKKLFKYLNIETEPMHGTVAASTIDEAGTVASVGSWTSTIPTVSLALAPQRQMALKITLTRDAGDITLGPVVNSYLIRAVPSVAPQRLYTLPLLCYDQEQARSGQRYGHRGYASERLTALQALEDVGDSLTFEDFQRGTTDTVVVDGIRFVQTNANPVFGGILVLQLRTVTT